jgi:hypothetical protein
VDQADPSEKDGKSATATPKEEAAAAAPDPTPMAHPSLPPDTPRRTNTFLKRSINWYGRHYPYVAVPCRSGLHGR